MKTLHLILATFFIVTMLNSCDIVDGNPYEIRDIEDPENPIADDTIKRVLLIEFTGQKCTNCPNAHAQIDILKENFGTRFVPVAIHAGSYAKPSTQFPNDFRTAFGNSFHDYIRPEGYPIGLVSSLSPTNQCSHTTWAEKIEESIKTPSHISIAIKDSVGDNEVWVNIKIKNVKPEIVSNDLKIYALLVEDSVVGKQQTPTGIDENYVHNHMLRFGLTDYLGDGIAFDNQNESEKNYKALINNNWRLNKLSIVVFIANSEETVLQTNYKNIEN